MDKDILKHIEQHNQYLYDKGFDTKNIIVSYAKPTYGMEDLSFDSFIFYMPTLKEICTVDNWVGRRYYLNNNEHIYLYDIRRLGKGIKEKSPNIMLVYDADNYIVNSKYETIYHKYFQKPKAELVEEGLVKLLKESQDQHFVSFDDFFSALTPAEVRALNSIAAETHGEGLIIISDMTTKYNISRPSYNNLLSKMRESKVAEITNRGSLGFDIKITLPDLLDYMRNKES